MSQTFPLKFFWRSKWKQLKATKQMKELLTDHKNAQSCKINVNHIVTQIIWFGLFGFQVFFLSLALLIFWQIWPLLRHCWDLISNSKQCWGIFAKQVYWKNVPLSIFLQNSKNVFIHSLKFLAKFNTSGSKKQQQQHLFLFTHIMITVADYQWIKTYF